MKYLNKINGNNKSDRKLIGNVIYSAAAKGISLIFFMATDIILARYLNVEGYAEWAFFYSIITMGYYIGWFGINISSKVHVADIISENTLNSYFKAGVLVRFLTSSAICLVGITLVTPLAYLLGYPKQYQHLLPMLKVGVLLIFFNSFMEFFKEIYIGIKNFRYLFVVTIIEYLGYFLFSFLFLNYRHMPIFAAAGYLCSGICVTALDLFMNRKRLFKDVMDISIVFKMKEIFVYALPLLVISIGGMILVELDTFMIGILGTKQDISYYNIIKQICKKLTHVNNALWAGTLSSIAYITKENVCEKQVIFNKVNKLNYLIILGVCLCVILLSPVLIPFLYGSQYAQAWKLMYWLLPYYVLYCISTFYSTFLDFQKKAKQRILWYISVIIIDITLNYILIPKWGMKGAAIATVVSLVPYTIYTLIATKILFKTYYK